MAFRLRVLRTTEVSLLNMSSVVAMPPTSWDVRLKSGVHTEGDNQDQVDEMKNIFINEWLHGIVVERFEESAHNNKVLGTALQ